MRDVHSSASNYQYPLNQNRKDDYVDWQSLPPTNQRTSLGQTLNHPFEFNAPSGIASLAAITLPAYMPSPYSFPGVQPVNNPTDESAPLSQDRTHTYNTILTSSNAQLDIAAPKSTKDIRNRLLSLFDMWEEQQWTPTLQEREALACVLQLRLHDLDNIFEVPSFRLFRNNQKPTFQETCLGQLPTAIFHSARGYTMARPHPPRESTNKTAHLRDDVAS